MIVPLQRLERALARLLRRPARLSRESLNDQMSAPLAAGAGRLSWYAAGVGWNRTSRPAGLTVSGRLTRGTVDRDEDFSAYVDARRATLVRSAVLLGCSYAEAEDVVQTAFIRCYRAWDKVRRASDVDAYVYRVLVNSLTESRRRRWWGERPSADLPEARGQDAAEAAVLSATVRQALLKLSQQHRAVLVLRFFADLSETQVAEALGIPAGTVKSRVSRALAQLSADSDLLDATGNRST